MNRVCRQNIVFKEIEKNKGENNASPVGVDRRQDIRPKAKDFKNLALTLVAEGF